MRREDVWGHRQGHWFVAEYVYTIWKRSTWTWQICKKREIIGLPEARTARISASMFIRKAGRSISHNENSHSLFAGSLRFCFSFTGFFREFLLFFLVIFAHELGHFLVARLFKQRIEHLTFTVLGGILKMEMTEISRFKQLLIYSAGIFVNLLLFLILKTLPDSQFKKLFANYNLLLICFNLLPIHPLDGFQIFQVLLSFFNSPYREFRISSLVSIWFWAHFSSWYFCAPGFGRMDHPCLSFVSEH